MDEQKDYTNAGFWQKLNTLARKAGREVVDKSLQLYYAAESPDTPRWAKGVIYCALAYFVAPMMPYQTSRPLSDSPTTWPQSSAPWALLPRTSRQK